MIQKYDNPKFDLGRIVITPTADKTIDEILSNCEVVLDKQEFIGMQILQRHVRGDWGEGMYEEDKELNDEAINFEGNEDKQQRVHSCYKFDNITLWVITEWDRSVTTILLPSDY